jgi:hypothetical protein
MNSFPDQVHNVIVGSEPIGRHDIDVKFEQAQRFIDAHWTKFDDPSGVAADLAELKLAVTGTRPANQIRTRLTLQRLNRIAGNAAPVAAIITVVREVLGTVQ